MDVRQSTAVVISFGPFVDKGDGVTPETGLVSALDHASTGIMLSKNGGALTIRHASVTASTYDAYGQYLVTLDTTDTATLGRVRMQFIETATCLPVWLDLMVMPANIWDSLYGSDYLQVDQAQWLGQTVAAVDTNGYPKVTVKDGTGQGEILTTSGKVDGVILADTLTTYTSNTPQTGDSYARIGAAGASLSAVPDLAGVTTLLARLTALRAGYLDNVNNSALATTVAQTGDVYPKVDTEVATLVTAAAAIQAKTDTLPSDPADASDVAAALSSLASTLATLATYIDTEVAAIKAKTDSLTFTAAGQVDANVQRINDVTITGDGSATPFGV